MTREKAIDFSSLALWRNFTEELGDDYPSAIVAHKYATDYLSFYDWVSNIDEVWVGVFEPNLISIFLIKIQTPRADVNAWIWVFVGDIPPAYIPADECFNAGDALDSYIGAMEDWVDAAIRGKSVADLIPVNVPATVDNAKKLATRLRLLDSEILPRLGGPQDKSNASK